AVDARPSEDILIVARTDAIEPEGIESALERAHAYAETGADVLFVEAPRTREELAMVGALPGTTLVNGVEGGQTPVVGTEELGFSIVLYANTALRAAMLAMRDVLQHLRATRSTDAITDRLMPWNERQALVGKAMFDELAERYQSEQVRANAG